MNFLLFYIFMMPAAVSALLIPGRMFCDINSIIIRQLRANAAATTYCSSYLSISTVTSTATDVITPTPVTLTASIIMTVAPVTRVETHVQNSVITHTAIQTKIQVVTESTSSTTTLTCLDSAFSAPTNNVDEMNKRNIIAITAIFPDTWARSQVSSACSCLSIPTPTTTITKYRTLSPQTLSVTATSKLTPTVDITTTAIETSTDVITSISTVTSTTTVVLGAVVTTVASYGIAYRQYNYHVGSGGGFSSSYYKGLTAKSSGIIPSLGFSTPNWFYGGDVLTLSDGKSFTGGFTTIVFNGFFIAQESGQYIFSTDANRIDNYGYLWTGDDAYAWDDGTAAYKSNRVSPPYIGGSHEVTLNKGDAIPFTWLWANEGGPGQSHVRLTTPSGEVLEDTTGYFAKPCGSGTFV